MDIHDTGWREFIRASLDVHGYTVDGELLRAFLTGLRAEGGRLFDELDTTVRECGAADGLLPLRGDAYLRSRLPFVAGLGAAQSRVLEAAIHGHRPQAVPLAAAVTVTSATLAHLVHQHGLGDQVFAAIEPRLLEATSADESRAREAVNELAPKVADPRVGVLVALVGVCAVRAWRLLRTGGRPETWRRLTELGGALLAAAAPRSTVEVLPAARGGQRSTAVTSTGPVQLGALFATLAAQSHGITPALVDVRPLGHLCSAVADLVDLPRDVRDGRPNRWRAAGDLHAVGGEAAGVVAGLVAELAPGPFGEFAALTVGAWTAD